MEVYDKILVLNTLLINGEIEKAHEIVADDGETFFRFIYPGLVDRYEYQNPELKDFIRRCNYEYTKTTKLNINYEAVASFVYGRIKRQKFSMPKGPYKTTCFVHRKAFIKYKDKYRCFFSMPEGKYSGFIYTVFTEYTIPVILTEKDLGFMFSIPESGMTIYSKEKGQINLSPQEFQNEVHMALEERYKYDYYIIDKKYLEYDSIYKAYVRLNNVYIGEFNIKKFGLNTIYAEKTDINVVNINNGLEYTVKKENMDKYIKTRENLILGDKTGQAKVYSPILNTIEKKNFSYNIYTNGERETFIPKCFLDGKILIPSSFHFNEYNNGKIEKLDISNFFIENERMTSIISTSFEEKITNNLLSGVKVKDLEKENYIGEQK